MGVEIQNTTNKQQMAGKMQIATENQGLLRSQKGAEITTPVRYKY